MQNVVQTFRIYAGLYILFCCWFFASYCSHLDLSLARTSLRFFQNCVCLEMQYEWNILSLEFLTPFPQKHNFSRLFMQQRYIDLVIRIMKGQFRIIQCSEREEKETTLFLTTYLSTYKQLFNLLKGRKWEKLLLQMFYSSNEERNIFWTFV